MRLTIELELLFLDIDQYIAVYYLHLGKFEKGCQWYVPRYYYMKDFKKMCHPCGSMQVIHMMTPMLSLIKIHSLISIKWELML